LIERWTAGAAPISSWRRHRRGSPPRLDVTVAEKGTQMSSGSKSDIIRRCFAAYKSKDRNVVEGLLTENFTFTSPYDDKIDKATYFERCWPNSERILTHFIERIFEQRNEAFVTYGCLTNEGTEFRNTEFFTFDGDRISSVNVYFGATYNDGAFVKGQ
jgi:ketosteroid isomerase-like protein